MAIIILSPTLFSGKVCEVCGAWHLSSETYRNNDKRCRACRDARSKVSADPKRREAVDAFDHALAVKRSLDKQTRQFDYSYRSRVPWAEGDSFTATEWRALCKEYGNRCLRCGYNLPLTADHVIPVSRGGSNTIDNIQPLCQPCNSLKGDRSIDYRPQ